MQSAESGMAGLTMRKVSGKQVSGKRADAAFVPAYRARWLALACLAGLDAAAGAAPSHYAARVKIQSGALQGVSSGGVIAFKGIPFAAPPVGAWRWRPPQPVRPWQGVRAADRFGAHCMQAPSAFTVTATTPSEDCLFLNVWRPAAPAAHKLPVMVWIYGGGFTQGASSQPIYAGEAFARQGVVLVSFNYRVQRLGFFAFPGLTAEHPAELKGNYALMDQIAALKWVKQNIAAFGGDPANVTIFGESAGGSSVHAHLTSPLSRGLFHKAISESGAGRDGILTPRPLSGDHGPELSAEAIGVNFARNHGIEGTGAEAVKRLRALSAREVIDDPVTGGGAAPLTYPGPIMDGRLTTETPESAYRAGHQARVPLIIGANSADFFRFPKTDNKEQLFAQFGPFRAEAIAAYDPDATRELGRLMVMAGTDRFQAEPARFTASAFAAVGVPSYVYRFSYVPAAMRDKWLNGAPHASELPFVFATVRAQYGDKATPQDEAVGQAMNTYWANFAKTGNPNGPGLPQWPRLDRATKQIVDFRVDGTAVGGPDPWQPRLDVAEKLAESKRR